MSAIVYTFSVVLALIGIYFIYRENINNIFNPLQNDSYKLSKYDIFKASKIHKNTIVMHFYQVYDQGERFNFGIVDSVTMPMINCTFYNRSHCSYYRTQYSCHIKDVRVPTLSNLNIQQQIWMRSYQEIIPFLRKQLWIIVEFNNLTTKKNKIHYFINEAKKLPEIYVNLEVYEKSLSKTTNLMTKSEDLIKLYNNLISKILLNADIKIKQLELLESLNNDSTLDLEILNTEVRTIREEYQYIEDREAAYQKLLKNVDEINE